MGYFTMDHAPPNFLLSRVGREEKRFGRMEENDMSESARACSPRASSHKWPFFFFFEKPKLSSHIGWKRENSYCKGTTME